MPGKVTAAQREIMLRLAREGVSQSEIMKRLNIWDRRTLKRNLKIAEEEEKLERVREKELEEATAAHMAEIRGVIEKWKDSIQMSQFAIGTEALVACRNIERGALFQCMKEHLPSESLWRDYELWKRRHVKYIGWGKELLEDVVKQGETKMKLGMRNYYYSGAKMTERFVNPTVERLDGLLIGEEPRAFEFRWEEEVAEREQRLMVLYVDGEDVLMVEAGKAKGEGYERRYQEVFDECVENHIKKLFSDLSRLKDKMEVELDEILIHRAYIFHQCKLCPGRELR